MKKTCINCTHFHSCLGESESFYHIHDYCDAWDRTITAPVNAEVNEFIDDFHSMAESGYYDDHETGLSGCYRFSEKEKADEFLTDEKMKSNFEYNRQLAITIIETILRTGEYPIFDKMKTVDDVDREYFERKLEQFKNLE